jgi:hypothetical protein
LLAGLTTFVLLPATAAADGDRGGGREENGYIAPPGAVPADARPGVAEAARRERELTIFAAAAVRSPIDDFPRRRSCPRRDGGGLRRPLAARIGVDVQRIVCRAASMCRRSLAV